jgi:hypothetical protein
MIKGGKEIKINEEDSYIEISSSDLKSFYIKQIKDVDAAIIIVESDANSDKDLLVELKKAKKAYQKELYSLK